MASWSGECAPRRGIPRTESPNNALMPRCTDAPDASMPYHPGSLDLLFRAVHRFSQCQRRSDRKCSDFVRDDVGNHVRNDVRNDLRNEELFLTRSWLISLSNDSPRVLASACHCLAHCAYQKCMRALPQEHDSIEQGTSIDVDMILVAAPASRGDPMCGVGRVYGCSIEFTSLHPIHESQMNSFGFTCDKFASELKFAHHISNSGKQI